MSLHKSNKIKISDPEPVVGLAGMTLKTVKEKHGQSLRLKVHSKKMNPMSNGP